MSWVMNRTVSPTSSRRSCSTFRMLTRRDASSIEVASSATNIFGRSISARAIMIRCRWPPESWCGWRSSTSAGRRPTWPSDSSIRSAPTFSSSSRSDRLSNRRTVKNWLNEENGSWKTACTSRQYAVRSLPLMCVTSLPRKVMVPEVIGSRPSTIRAIVDLPEPDSPTIVTTSFSSRLNETSFTACTSFLPLPKVLVMFLASSSVVTSTPPPWWSWSRPPARSHRARSRRRWDRRR